MRKVKTLLSVSLIVAVIMLSGLTPGSSTILSDPELGQVD